MKIVIPKALSDLGIREPTGRANILLLEPASRPPATSYYNANRIGRVPVGAGLRDNMV